MKKIYICVAMLVASHFSGAQSWQSMTDIPLSLAFPVVVELRGDIHMIGGGSSAGTSNLHLRYAPATNSWDTLAPVPYLAQQPAGAVVDGKIHFCGGGYPTTGQRLDLHYYYDVDSDAWFQAANMPGAVAIHKCASLDGKLYVMSGQPDKSLCETYDPVTDTWTQKNPLPDMDFWYGVIVSANNSIYRFGGGGYTAPATAANVYDKVNDTWINIPRLPVALHGAAGTNIGDSLIWIMGGYNGGDLDEVWIYDINAQTYTLTDSLPIPRSYHSAVNIGGCVYSAGGNHNGAPQVEVSLLQNCSPNFTAVQETKSGDTKPYLFSGTFSHLQVQLTEGSKSKPSAVKIVDMHGRTVVSLPFGKPDGSFSFNGSDLSAGMYLVLIAVGDNSYVEQWMVTR